MPRLPFSAPQEFAAVCSCPLSDGCVGFGIRRSPVRVRPPRPEKCRLFGWLLWAEIELGGPVGETRPVPIREHAQGVVIAQRVGGQMYLAVLVARLVSLYSAQETG